MIYVFDSGPLIDLFGHYYPERFPSLWRMFDELVQRDDIISVREVSLEVIDYGDRLSDWAKINPAVFKQPEVGELVFVREIFGIAHFQALLNKKQRLQNKPVADPFVIAKAKSVRGSVVSTEVFKDNAARIPNICDYFGIPHLSLEKFMKAENWTF